jgi:hypothetical protein
MRRTGEYFDHQIDDLSGPQFTGYFSDLITTHSWRVVKYDLYGLKFYTLHVLGRPWQMPQLIKPPNAQRLSGVAAMARWACDPCISPRQLRTAGNPNSVRMHQSTDQEKNAIHINVDHATRVNT